MVRFLTASIAALLVGTGTALAQTSENPSATPAALLHHQPLRPQFHFSPAKNWMNDPNGLVYANGTYHLFFQQNPDGMQMGAIHWGHATSLDLTHWEEQPTALAPDKLGYIFSGSAVLDEDNTSGFGEPGKPALVAIFTSHNPNGSRKTAETQSLAYSLDNGQTWTKYADNPVLKNPGQADFRDPKVFWYKPGKKWIMALAVHDHIALYSSPNLKQWTKESEFGQGHGAHGGVWECPDLIQLDDQGAQVRRWALIVSLNPGGPNGGSATQYFVGDFDGKTFTTPQREARWIDYGPDDYAGVTYSNTKNRKIFVGWMNNWLYGQKVPTSPWRGAMTFPREIGLKTVGGTPWVVSQPTSAITGLLGASKAWQNMTIQPSLDLSAPTRATSGRCMVTFTMPRASDWSVVLSNAKGERVMIGYHKNARQFYLDRAHSGNTTFAPGFARVAYAPRIQTVPSMDVTLLIDSTSAELFADGGLSCLTGTFFPHAPLTRITLNAPHPLLTQDIACTALSSIWDFAHKGEPGEK